VPALSSPYSALHHHAKLASEEPWLFRSEGLDWRWHTLGDLARRAAAWAAHLAGRPPGSRVAFPYRPGPESIALDLGIMGAGLVSVPVSGDFAVSEVPLPRPSSPRPSSPAPSQPPSPGEEGEQPELPSTGGAVVLIEGSAVELSAAELIVIAERVQTEIAPARRAGEREIVVLGGPLEAPEERAMWAWATVTGAAVALEPTPGLRIATAAWVRPTVFHGRAEEIAALRGWMGKKKKRGLPFGRLRTLLVAGGELGEEEAVFWREWGVRLGRVPPLAAERHKHGI
jgi:hypothetical protein